MKLRNYLAAAVAAAPLALVAGSASAGTFTYSGYNVVNNTNVVIQAGSVNGTFGSGQIDLVGSGPDAGKTLPTWCIDAFYDLQGSGTYNIVSPPFNNSGGDVTGQSIDSTTLAKIANLVHYGDANVSVGITSPAVQLAIWDVEYAGYGYTFTSSNADVNSEVTSLVNQANGTAGPGLAVLPISYLKEVVLVGPGGNQLNQGLVYELSSVPIPGALLLFGSAIAAVGGMNWINKRRGRA